MAAMTKYSFNERKDLLIPTNANMRPITDKNGNPVIGDELLKRMAKIAVKFSEKHGKPVPIAQQNFIAWLKQAGALIEQGKTSEQVFEQTLVKSTNI